MTRHLLKLIWNRKRSNLLLMSEIFFSFLVLLFVVGLGLYYVDNYRQPLGYSYADVWRITIDPNLGGPNPSSAEAVETGRQLLMAAKDLPQVETAAIAFTAPFGNGSWSTDYEADGRHFEYELNRVTDDFAKVMGLEVVRGRWFDRQDDAAAVEPVVVNERLSRIAFGALDPIGRLLPQDKERDGKERPPKQVIGVIRDFRQHGEFDAPGSFLFSRTNLATTTDGPRLLLVKVRPGTTAAFQETLTRRFEGVAKDWSFKVQSLTEMRDTNHRERLAPVLAVSLVAGFLLLMVALGLTGVLWQNVTQRTREIGLRRAKGATARNIYGQIVGEILMMTTLSLVLAVVLVLQLPFLGLLSHVAPRVLVASLFVSIAALYGLAAICGMHPARLATRVQPAEALHYE
ncbi:MAG: ABC transporter permease [Vicinamibacteria bacterium]